MIDLNKYSEKEIVAAIKVVESIVDAEDFNIDIVEEDGELCFSLIDRQGAYLGDIGADRFSSLGGIIDRMDIYHIDFFYNDYYEREDQGEEIPRDDWDRKILIFLESGYCQNLLMDIDVETFQKYKDKELDDVEIDSDEVERYVENGKFDTVGYVIDKAIALEIMDTQSAYDVIVNNGIIYELYNNDNPNFVVEFKKALGEGNIHDFDFWVYETFADLIDSQKKMILDDFRDIGLYDDKDNWSFYLSEYELEYIGLGDEKDKLKEEYEDILMLSENDVSDEFMEIYLESIVENAKNRSAVDNANVGKNRANIDKELEQ